MPQITRRSALACGAAALLVSGRRNTALAQRRVVLNDASRLNPTPVAKHWVTPDGAQFVEQLRSELREAAAAGRPFAVGAARHSMGGQSLPRNGTAATFAAASCEPDIAGRTYRVHAGTRWKDVIATLDPLGFSPAVMQSNNDFGVAATLSVNAHGWPAPYGPFGSTVRSIRLMLADGALLACSRTENEELFSLAMGGYGLVGVILDLEIEMVPNRFLTPRFQTMSSRRFGEAFVRAIEQSGVDMAYGRLSVARANFLEESLMVTFQADPTPRHGLPPASSGGLVSAVSREIYRAQVGSEAAKRARWFAEAAANRLPFAPATRNRLMNEPVASLAGRNRRRTDILHEYFVPPGRFAEFVRACKEVIPRSKQELLNVTLRYVASDRTSVLAFAPTKRIAAVMSFSQELTPEAEADMIVMTEELIDRVLDLDGTFYLPYRLHARRDQLTAAYPNAARFAERKRYYDPGHLFRNTLWEAYFA
jgi:FAD/FMN-containing dehydrogenase